MPNVQPQRLASLAPDATLQAVLRAQDKHNTDVSQALNAALVRGDTVQLWTPYTATAPLVVPSDWTTITAFSNSWAVFSGSFNVQWRITASGDIRLQGAIKSGTVGNSAFTLASVAPSQDVNLAADSNDAFGKLTISGGTGVVTPAVGSNVFFSVDCSWTPATRQVWVPSCFPFDVLWQASQPPVFIVAQAVDVTNAASPSNQAQCLTDWTTVQQGGRTFVRIRNIPGLLPSTSYAIQVWGF